MIDLLFICQGNIARSQIAEWFAKKYFPNKNIKSCWIDNVWYKYNFMCYKPAIGKMKEKNIDISKQKPKEITKDLVENSKKIIVFCKEKECNNSFTDYLKNHKNVEYLAIWDPNKKWEVFLKNTINQIEKIVIFLYWDRK